MDILFDRLMGWLQKNKVPMKILANLHACALTNNRRWRTIGLNWGYNIMPQVLGGDRKKKEQERKMEERGRQISNAFASIVFNAYFSKKFGEYRRLKEEQDVFFQRLFCLSVGN